MKRILLLVVTISLIGNITAQENIWDDYLQGQAVKSIVFDSDYVWAATDSFLVRLNKVNLSTNYYPYPYTCDYDCAYKLNIDKNGVIWLARSEYYPAGSNYYHRWSIIYSFAGNQWKEVKDLGYGRVCSMALDKNDNLWIATYTNNGLYKIEQDDSCMQYTPENSGLIYDRIADVGSDKDGNIWMANYEDTSLLHANIALIKYDGDVWISHNLGEDLSFMTMKIDNQGNPWLQSLNLLRKLDPISNTWTDIVLYDLLGTSLVGLMTIEGDNKLWFSTSEYNEVDGWWDTGIALYDGSDWSHYSTLNSELPSDTVYQIAVDDNGTKWIATDQGLAAFNENGLLSTTDHSTLMDDIVLFPNPAKDFITLKLPEWLQYSTVDILNIQGRKINTFVVNHNRAQVDVSSLSSGIYLVRIQSDKTYTMKKFVKH